MIFAIALMLSLVLSSTGSCQTALEQRGDSIAASVASSGRRSSVGFDGGVRPNTGRVVAGGILGAAIGSLVAWPATPRQFRYAVRHGTGTDTYSLYGSVAIVSLGESLGLAAGSYVANDLHGRVVAATAADFGTALAGFVFATGLAKAIGTGAFVVIPIAQFAVTLPLLH